MIIKNYIASFLLFLVVTEHIQATTTKKSVQIVKEEDFEIIEFKNELDSDDPDNWSTESDESGERLSHELISCARMQDLGMFEAILDSNTRIANFINVNLQDREGKTALHHALYNQYHKNSNREVRSFYYRKESEKYINQRMIELLDHYLADRTIRDKNGLKPGEGLRNQS